MNPSKASLLGVTYMDDSMCDGMPDGMPSCCARSNGHASTPSRRKASLLGEITCLMTCVSTMGRREVLNESGCRSTRTCLALVFR